MGHVTRMQLNKPCFSCVKDFKYIKIPLNVNAKKCRRIII